MKRSVMLVFIIAITAALLSGCKASNEINAMSLIMGIAVDKGEKENEYEVTAQIAQAAILKGDNTGSGGTTGNGEGYVNITKKGIGVSDAMLAISQVTNREFYTGHIQVIVISREVAEDGVGSVLDYFIGSKDGRLSTTILIAADKAKDLFEQQNTMEKSPAAFLAKLMDTQYKEGEITKSPVVTFLNDVIGGFTASTAPVAEIVKDENGVPFIEVTGVAAFEDFVLKDVMTIKQSRFVLAMKNQIRGGFLRVEKDGKYMMLDTESASASISAEFENGKPKMIIKLYRTYLVDDSTWEIDYLNEEERKEVENATIEQGKQHLNDILSWAKERKLDVFGFGDYLFRHHRKETKELLQNWSDNFPDLEVEFRISLKILGPGTLLQNLKPIDILEG